MRWCFCPGAGGISSSGRRDGEPARRHQTAVGWSFSSMREFERGEVDSVVGFEVRNGDGRDLD